MRLEPFSTRWAGVVTQWLVEEDNWKSLEMGVSEKKTDPLTFRMLSRQPKHKFFLFFDKKSNQPIGLVAFSDINDASKTARLWYLLGEKKFAKKGYTARAVNECLKYGFKEMGLKTVYAWLVKKNDESGKILESNHFNYIGCRRRCHPIDGTVHDRALYDLLSSEFNDKNSTEPFHSESAYSDLIVVNP